MTSTREKATGSSNNEVASYYLKSKHNKGTAPIPKHLFRQEDYTNKDNPENLSSIRVQVKMIRTARKRGMVEEQNIAVNFGSEITGINANARIIVLCSSIRGSGFFTQQQISIEAGNKSSRMGNSFWSIFLFHKLS